MLDVATGIKVDRLPIVGSQSDFERILRVPKLLNGTGAAIADVVFDTITEYNLMEVTEAICFDTEKANTGIRNGAAALLEKKMGRSLLYLACRHHIYELILKDIFITKCMKSKTTAPNVEMFERLKNSWNQFFLESYLPGIEDEIVIGHIDAECMDEMLEFCYKNLQKDHCRADYREFLELVVIFLGGQLPGGNKIKKPGAIHHARWMAKAITSLKIFLLRDQFPFKDNDELTGLRDVCIFLVRLYVKAWFQTTCAIRAPRIDLCFIKDSIDYAKIDEEISARVLEKISNHLWYLSEETVAFAFFDDEIPVDEKKKMVSALSKQHKSLKTLNASGKEIKSKYKSKCIHDFVSVNTKHFFDRFDISTDFLSVDPTQWSQREDYKKGHTTCANIHVVNDAAERAVKLFSHYNDILCKDEDEKQHIIKLVQHYKSLYPSINKSQLAKFTP